jgi:prepilin-type N-terminal cleavage/methylation domain-containing protein
MRRLTGAAGATPAARARRGFTLVEVLIVMVLFGIVGGVITRVIMRQQRFYHGVNQIMGTRTQLRQATSVLPVELRTISSSGGDVLSIADSAVEVRLHIASGIVCQMVGGNDIVLPPVNLASGATLTAMNQQPQLGDLLFVYNDSSRVGTFDDRWQPLDVSAVTTSSGHCLGPMFAGAADLGKSRVVIRVTSTAPNDLMTGGPISRYVPIGAPVRVLRRVRYSLFQDTDGLWYLGFAEWNPSTSNYPAATAVAGPYDTYASGTGAASGIGFRYYDVDGTEITSGASAATIATIARVDLRIRGRTIGRVRADGLQGGAQQQYRDSLAMTVMFRNRR